MCVCVIQFATCTSKGAQSVKHARLNINLWSLCGTMNTLFTGYVTSNCDGICCRLWPQQSVMRSAMQYNVYLLLLSPWRSHQDHYQASLVMYLRPTATVSTVCCGFLVAINCEEFWAWILYSRGYATTNCDGFCCGLWPQQTGVRSAMQYNNVHHLLVHPLPCRTTCDYRDVVVFSLP